MNDNKTQIGWFHLKADKVFRNTFEFAAWYEDVLVPAGKYPIFVYGLNVRQSNDPMFNRRLSGKHDSNMTYTFMDGTITSDYFAAHYFGVPISDYDKYKNAGKPSSYHAMWYMYEIAASILNDPDTPYELLPQYEARAVTFVSSINGHEITTHNLFLKDSEEGVA